MGESLKQKAIDGVLWSAIQKFGVSFLSFLSNIIMARLLTPDDYGCLGLLAIFIAVSNSLVLGGFISALIQKKDADSTDFSTVFIFNVFISVGLYLILYNAAPLIAGYYGIKRLSSILRVQGIILIINAFSAVQSTILRKTFQFKKLATIYLVSSVISIAVALVFAYLGYGVWALVAQQLTASFCNSVFLWSTSRWMPTFLFSLSSLKKLFSYGIFLLLSDIINTICDNLQGLIIGKKFSSSIMGYYSQAKRLEEVPTQSISQLVAQVTFPIYAKIQDDTVKLQTAVKETLSLMNFVNLPLMIMLIVIAKPLIIVLYTDRWISSIPYFQILCVAGLVNCLQSVNYQVVSATGRSRQLFTWNFIKRGSAIFLMLIGSVFGVKGILWGMVISYYIIFFINAYLAYESTHYSISSQLKDSFPMLLTSSISALLTYLIAYFIYNISLLLIVQIVVFIISYILFSLLFKRKELTELSSIILNYLCKLRVVK